ncbi:MAG: hypothetical protein Kow0025_00390 [Thermodesulfovibrionales bacterium]
MDNLVETFTDSTRYVLSAVSGIEPEICENGGQDLSQSFVTGTLSLKGCACGSMSISFTREAIHRIYLKVFPNEEATITFSNMGDLAGEITNMICGKAREILSATGVRLYATIPRILFGSRVHIGGEDPACQVVHFKLDGDSLFLELKKSPVLNNQQR